VYFDAYILGLKINWLKIVKINDSGPTGTCSQPCLKYLPKSNVIAEVHSISGGSTAAGGATGSGGAHIVAGGKDDPRTAR